MRVMLAILALALLTSCASLRKERVVYVAPQIDCAVSDVPRAKIPTLPSLNEGKAAWQLYAYGWQAYAEDVLMQRVETADCLEQMRQKGLVK